MGAVKNAMTRDSEDPSIMDLDPEKSVASQLKQEEEEDEEDVDKGLPLKDAKYFKMLKMGLPKGAVQNAMTRDGEDPSIMDLDPEKSVASQLDKGEEDEVDNGPPLKDDPKYAKYFKMLKMVSICCVCSNWYIYITVTDSSIIANKYILGFTEGGSAECNDT